MIKRIFLIVMDSVGIGELPDANEYSDEGSNTLKSCSTSEFFVVPTLRKLGLFNIDGIDFEKSESEVKACYGRLNEKSKGKDTTIGHWELAGIVSEKPLPVYPNGFPERIIDEFSKLTNKRILCNKPYSGTAVIKDFGREQIETGGLIVYTSADSVFQIAAHEAVIPPEELYGYCKIARKLLCDEHGVGRVIARPFIGEYPNYTRTSNRHDFSLEPRGATMLDELKASGYDVISVGKIIDIFANRGITESYRTKSNSDGMKKTTEILSKDFRGLCFINLVDFDMLYGHRNDVDGYAKALSEFDRWLNDFTKKMGREDVLILTADHGCDPKTASTDHSREYVPLLVYGKEIRKGKNLGTRKSFADVGATILEAFCIKGAIKGKSFLKEIIIE